MNTRMPIIFLAVLTFIKSGPAFEWSYSNPESLGFSPQKLEVMKQQLIQRGTKKLLIIKNDKIICSYFAPGWEDSQKGHYSASLAKALVGGMSLLLALDDELVFPDMPVCLLIPQWKKAGSKNQITIRQLASHTSGLADAEVDDKTQQLLRSQGLHPHMDLPGWKGQFWRKEPDPFTVSRDSCPVVFTPGTAFAYSNPGIAMLTYAITASLKNTGYSDVGRLLENRIFSRIGITDREYSLGYGKIYEVDGLQLLPSWGGGSFTANAAARIGRLMLRKGNWEGEQLIDPEWVEQVTQYAGTPLPGSDLSVVQEKSSLRTANNPFPASTMGWYSNFDGVWPHVPRDAFCGAGAGNQHLFVIPSMDLIIVRFGSHLYDEEKGERFWEGAEKQLLNPAMDACTASPYPRSEFIKSASFAPKEEILRLAKGSDNWPVTWTKDDNLFTAYGDGWGFEPFVDIKLSLGFARVAGIPPDITGQNLRSNSGEFVGQGKFGPKASGLLAVDGTLYCLVRNRNNACLGWSDNNGTTWHWADWRFDIGFGCPTFLNYGRDNQNAPDDWVYIYSQDDNTAYKPADWYVLARVKKGNLKDWREYFYFSGIGKDGEALWSEDPRQRKPVFINPGKCYRSHLSYNAGLDRYLWVQIIPLSVGDGPRFQGGIGIFESEKPWGPWKTVYYTREWDVGPGESASLPPKWISPDGKTAFLLFSGEDSFSVRKVTFSLDSR